jgi:spermidine synthase
MAKAIPQPAARQPLAWLLLLFAGSGCAALIYEIVWFQLLQLVIGSSAVSLGVLLGTFMGGMCLGSVALPRLIGPGRHPLRVYAALEFGLALLGLGVLFGIPYVDRIYVAAVGHGLPAVLLRGAVCAVCLLPPTVLMGATLPAVARWVEATPQGVAWLGRFYAGNIAGAVFGCLLAGFYLLRVHDMATATYVAAALNVGVALLGLELATTAAYVPAPVAARGGGAPAWGSWPVYLAIAVSGACALGAEVVWTRLLSLMLGATVYTFSIILAVFLVGLGLGSSLGADLASATTRPRVALGWCQLLLAAAIAWTACILAHSLPFWPINPYLSTSPWFTFQVDLLRCTWTILPATILWGASFPLALAAVAARDRDPGRLVGGVYAANTLGAIVGALGCSLFVIRRLGTQEAQRLLIAASGAAAILLLAPQSWPFTPAAPSGGALRRLGLRLTGPAVLGAAAGVVVFLAITVSEVPWQLIAFGRTLVTYDDRWKNLYVGEGMTSSVAVTEHDTGTRHFHVSGKVEASTQEQDMRLQRMLAHLPALAHPRPRSVLVVGCGAGVTAGSFVPYPNVERIVLCEIEPLVPQIAAEYFGKQNYDVVHDRRVEIVHDDARHYILTTPNRFDIITSDPIHPWVKGSATLYSWEYFELCKRHLNPGGVITQWVPLYESKLPVVQSEIATFFEAFPHGTVWGNPDNDGKGYDLVLMGQFAPTRIDVDELLQRLDRPDHRKVVRSLKDTGFNGGVSLLATYAGRAADLGPWLEGARINRDADLRLQYLAGMWLNSNESDLIYDQMLKYRRLPTDVFTGSGPGLRSLLRRIAVPATEN